MLDRFDEFPALALVENSELAVADLELSAGGEEAGEHDPLGVGGDVNEPAAAGGEVRLRTQLGDIDVAVAIYLQEGEECHIETATLKVRELVGRCAAW